ncbi:MAG: caspase family protein [Desulfuromonadaceae bacterium]|nr:caspase family protein [Desulfuromonadaceae bacterium]
MNKLVILMFLTIFATPALAADTCDIAATLAEKGVKTFASNKAEGLKLLIKARELCSSDPAYSYNLGVAYYHYGRGADALPLLEAAVAKNGSKASWLNNLAVVQLEQGLPADGARKLAEKAVKLDSADPAIQETLAQARYAAGREVEALQGLAAANDNQLVKTRAALLDRYLAAQLQRIQHGEEKPALSALQQVAFLPDGARTYALVLARLGRGEAALLAIGAAQKNFPRDRSIGDAADEVGEQVAAGLYRDYQSGQTGSAVQQAKKLAEDYPQMASLKIAYDKLLEALVADATTINVPAAGQRKSRVAVAGASDALLAGIGSVAGGGEAVNLRVDVDENIPTGKQAGRDDVAVVIGNRSYGVAGTPNVDYALRDAAVMREYLVKTLGFDAKNILYVENATYAGFAQLFGREGDHRGKLNNYVVPGKSDVFVYYVGHGAPDPESGDAYFVPVDADPQYLGTGGYRLQTFYDNLAKLPAKSITVVLDSCFSGNSAGGLLFKGVSSISLRAKAVVAPARLTVFASSRDDQMSNWYDEKRHSLFTYYFLKGLGGEADADNNRKVTVAELATYLDAEVPRMARRLKGAAQAPQISGDRSAVLADLR